MSFDPADPKFRELNRLVGNICNFLEKSDEPYENKMRMLFAAIGQHSFEPGKGEWIIAELRELIAHIRGMVLGVPGTTGFYTEAELTAFRGAGHDVEISTCENTIEIAREAFAGTNAAAGSNKTFAHIWFKQ
jgi:hypothetical protein